MTNKICDIIRLVCERVEQYVDKTTKFGIYHHHGREGKRRAAFLRTQVRDLPLKKACMLLREYINNRSVHDHNLMYDYNNEARNLLLGGGNSSSSLRAMIKSINIDNVCLAEHLNSARCDDSLFIGSNELLNGLQNHGCNIDPHETADGNNAYAHRNLSYDHYKFHIGMNYDDLYTNEGISILATIFKHCNKERIHSKILLLNDPFERVSYSQILGASSRVFTVYGSRYFHALQRISDLMDASNINFVAPFNSHASCRELTRATKYKGIYYRYDQRNNQYYDRKFMECKINRRFEKTVLATS